MWSHSHSGRHDPDVTCWSASSSTGVVMEEGRHLTHPHFFSLPGREMFSGWQAHMFHLYSPRSWHFARDELRSLRPFSPRHDKLLPFSIQRVCKISHQNQNILIWHRHGADSGLIPFLPLQFDRRCFVTCASGFKENVFRLLVAWRPSQLLVLLNCFNSFPSFSIAETQQEDFLCAHL